MADPFARISSMLESARDLTIEAAVSASTRLSETPTAKRPQEIQKLLNSRTEREVLNGMKCVIALVARDEDGTPYFADVVKNVTLGNARVRALVLIYLQKYAEKEPDTALLLINSIQKALSDKKPNARAAAIRTLGGIKIPEIALLLALCIKRTVSDSLPQVRAATALAIGKSFEIDGINKTQLAHHLYGLLSDDSPVVVGASIKVYCKLKAQLVAILAKKAWAPIHANFRRYTRIVSELDEWSACFLLDLMTEYSRRFLPRPTLVLADGTRLERPDEFSGFPDSYTCEMDADLAMFVSCVAPLSSGPDILVLSAVKALMVVGTPEHIAEYGFATVLAKMAVQPTALPTRVCALETVGVLAHASPQLFALRFRAFFAHPRDSVDVAGAKLHVLEAVFSDTSAKPILGELQYGAVHYRPEIARIAVRVLGTCAQVSARWTTAVLKWCVHSLEHTFIADDLLTVVRRLLQALQASGADNKILVRAIYKLAVLLQDVHLDASARASIVWIIGEFTAAAENQIGPDVLRRMLKTFSAEDECVRYELLVLAAKSYHYEVLRNPDFDTPLGHIFRHIMHLCRYDPSFDTRDRVRMWDQLLTPTNVQLAALFLEVPKPPPAAPATDMHHSLELYFDAIPWADPADLPPLSIRKEVEKTTHVTHVEGARTLARVAPVSSEPLTTRKHNLQSLDEFFNDSDDQSGEDSDDESENESDDEADGKGSESSSEFEGSDSEIESENAESSDENADSSDENADSTYARDDVSSAHSYNGFLA